MSREPKREQGEENKQIMSFKGSVWKENGDRNVNNNNKTFIYTSVFTCLNVIALMMFLPSYFLKSALFKIRGFFTLFSLHFRLPLSYQAKKRDWGISKHSAEVKRAVGPKGEDVTGG